MIKRMALGNILPDWLIFAIIGALISAIVLLILHIKIVNWVTKDCKYSESTDIYSNIAPYMVLFLPFIGILIYLLIRSYHK